jgi:hypothetical protein
VIFLFQVTSTILHRRHPRSWRVASGGLGTVINLRGRPSPLAKLHHCDSHRHESRVNCLYLSNCSSFLAVPVSQEEVQWQRNGLIPRKFQAICHI